MTARDLVIGLDSSTTASKAVIWDREGNTVASGRAAHPVLKPRPSWHEQPAGIWWDAARQAVREAASQVDANRIAALCIAPQRETFVITDQQGMPLHNSLLWMDERCRELLPEIERGYGKDRIHRVTGKPLSANLTLGKLFWLARFHPELCSRANLVCDVHAYLSIQFSGRFVTSWGCADPTGLFDMQRRGWDTSLVGAAGFHLEQFPEAVAPGTLIGPILPGAARACGLPAGVLLVAGLGDGQAAGLGVNASQPGESYLNLGTAVVSGTISHSYLHDPAFRTMFAGIPGAYYLETVLLGGTYTISWFLEKFYDSGKGSRAPEQVLEQEARQVPPGSEGLMLVPYWNSAMNPYWDASASGIVIGWRGIHGRAHLYRAILEGIAFEQRLHTQGVEAALGEKISRLVAVGGGARSGLWRQVIADITQKSVLQANAPEATALGAGMLAAAAAGIHPDILTAAGRMSRISTEETHPSAERVEFYDKLYNQVYCNIYPALKPYLSSLADLSPGA